jgi:hypothetical protein
MLRQRELDQRAKIKSWPLDLDAVEYLMAVFLPRAIDLSEGKLSTSCEASDRPAAAP